MKIKNNLLIDIINGEIISHNENLAKEQIALIENGEISNENLEKLSSLHIDISNLQEDEKEMFFCELGNVLKSMQLKNLSIFSQSKEEPIQINVNFLSKINKDIEFLQIRGIDLKDADIDIFNQFKNLKVLGLGNNNINDFNMLSKIDENIAIDVGDNPLNNVSINDIVNEIQKHHGKMAFNDHPYLNAIVFALEDKELDLSRLEIPEDKKYEILQFARKYQIQIPIKIEDYKKMGQIQNEFNSLIISGTSDISTEFLEKHPEISEIKIVDEENRCDREQGEPYSRKDFIKIRQKIDEIKEKIKIPDDLDEDREKKIFMQVYTILGKMIDYNYYAISEEGKKDSELQVTCRNLKDGLLQEKAVCAGYADILKNVLGEFGIKAEYIGRNPENVEIYAEKIGYSEEVALSEILGYETLDILEFAKSYGYQDDHGHAWNSVILDGKKYLCDLTWDADDIKLNHFPLCYCCSSLDEFNSVGNGEITHDMFETMYDGEISEFSSEDQLRFLGISEEEIEKRLHPPIEDFIKMLEKMETVAVSVSSEIKASDFDGIEKAFEDKEKEEQKGYDK